MTTFATTFLIVIGAYALFLAIFSVVKYVQKRKDQKNKPNDEDKKDDQKGFIYIWQML